MERYPGTGLFKSKRRYMMAILELYPSRVERQARRRTGLHIRHLRTR